MSAPQDTEFHATWQKLCSIFAKRSTILPRWKELLPTLLNFSNDQFSWHRQHNTFWKDATEILRTLPKPLLESLCQSSEENYSHLKSRMSIGGAVFSAVLVFLGLTIPIQIAFVGFMDGSTGSLLQGLEIVSNQWMVTGVILVAYLWSILRTWDTLEQGRELKCCVHAELDRRLAAEKYGNA